MHEQSDPDGKQNSVGAFEEAIGVIEGKVLGSTEGIALGIALGGKDGLPLGSAEGKISAVPFPFLEVLVDLGFKRRAPRVLESAVVDDKRKIVDSR